eukprot:Hpha_TRINITY_DN621_c0_g1::TRINITY_DN621_c0_g1_i1::g.21237::m.21237
MLCVCCWRGVLIKRLQTHNFGRTALWWAAANGMVSVLEVLVEGGANIEARDSEGKTPLWAACYWNEGGVVRVLLEGGADRHAPNTEGVTPLGIAEEKGHGEVARILSGEASDEEEGGHVDPTSEWL